MSVTHSQRTCELADVTATNHDSKRCHLLELPAELRVRIYESVYDQDKVVDLYIFNKQGTVLRAESSDPTRDQTMRHLPSLLKTCTLLSREANPVLYQSLQFSVCIDSEFGSPLNAGHLTELCSIHGCLFFRNVQRLRLLIRIRNYVMSARANEYLGLIWGGRETCAAKTKTIIEEVTVFNHQCAGEGVDELYATLGRFSYSPGARWYHTQDTFGLPRFVSEHVWKDFEQKTGVLRCVRAAGEKVLWP
ncbi:hypothetical protein LTR97_011036 [Elasticomyces elasticus]|uniref:F-box domain-containing protein n=1 Tax=Elasticomyces elasticus TaxID=574655 RepID=A0AAN7W2C4_9PEZI|nr:hypothetical protein LTR97_011036 [Elasticomyces elasticus]